MNRNRSSRVRFTDKRTSPALQSLICLAVAAMVLATLVEAQNQRRPGSISPSVAVSGTSGSSAGTISYPPTKRVDQVDDYFGTKVPDPYRWLEDERSPETAAWVEAENKVTFAYLDKIAYR